MRTLVVAHNMQVHPNSLLLFWLINPHHFLNRQRRYGILVRERERERERERKKERETTAYLGCHHFVGRFMSYLENFTSYAITYPTHVLNIFLGK